MKISDFDIVRRLGDGSFSTVVLATLRDTGRQYAIKIINKSLIMRHKMVEFIKNERNVLDALDFVGVAKLHFTFQDEDNLYMGLEYCPGGELFEQLRQKGRFSPDVAQFYAAEIVAILGHLREQGVVHRWVGGWRCWAHGGGGARRRRRAATLPRLLLAAVFFPVFPYSYFPVFPYSPLAAARTGSFDAATAKTSETE